MDQKPISVVAFLIPSWLPIAFNSEFEFLNPLPVTYQLLIIAFQLLPAVTFKKKYPTYFYKFL